MTFTFKRFITTIEIEGNLYDIVELQYKGDIPFHDKTPEQFAEENRYGTLMLGKYDCIKDTICLGEILPASNMTKALENRFRSIQLQKILEKYGCDYRNEECANAIMQEFETKRNFLYLLKVINGKNAYGQPMIEHSFHRTIEEAMEEDSKRTSNGFHTFPIIMEEDR